MAAMRVARRPRSPWWILAIVIFLGALLGSVIAEALVGYPVLSFLSRDLFYGVDPPFTLNARVFTFTICATIRLNLAIVLGIVLAIWLFRQLS